MYQFSPVALLRLLGRTLQSIQIPCRKDKDLGCTSLCPRLLKLPLAVLLTWTGIGIDVPLWEMGVKAMYAYCDPCLHLNRTYIALIFDGAPVGDRSIGLVNHDLRETPIEKM